MTASRETLARQAMGAANGVYALKLGLLESRVRRCLMNVSWRRVSFQFG
jgi:hypothetical protein